MTLIENDLHCLVFRTSLKTSNDVANVSGLLNSIPGIIDWFVDLDDWEKVLRIECEHITPEAVIFALEKFGIDIEELPV